MSRQRHEASLKPKKWSTKFNEKISKNEELNKKSEKVSCAGENILYGMWARAAIAKKLSSHVRKQVRDKTRSCKKSLLNLHEPTQLEQFQPHWDIQLNCEVCNKPAIYESIGCETCNVVVHFACANIDKTLSGSFQKGEHWIKYYEETDDEPEKYELQCAVCEDFRIDEEEYYLKEKNRLIEERMMKKYAKVIVTRLRTYVVRKNYLKRKLTAVTCQALLRKLFTVKRYAVFSKNRLRILNLDIKHFPKIPAQYICWTAVDFSKGVQVFRYDREISQAEKEGFLVPGASSYLSMYLSFVKVEGSHFYIVGQAQLALRDIDPFKPDQLISLVMSNNVQWIPQETRNERMVFTTKRESKTSKQDPMHRLSQRDRTCVIRYNALSSFTSFGVSAQGPPVDVLRKAPESFMTQSLRKVTVMPERKTRWWLVLAELNLVFYQVFGDTKPRYSVPIFDCSVAIVKDSGSRHHACITLPDKRKWDFEFDDMLDMKRFVFAIVECRKGMDNQSIYFKPGRKFDSTYGNNFHSS